MYYKLYSDGDPIITVMLPSIIHFVIILILKKQVEIIQFLPLVLLDILFLIVKGVKGSMFPFVFEGEDEIDELSLFEDLDILETIVKE